MPVLNTNGGMVKLSDVLISNVTSSDTDVLYIMSFLCTVERLTMKNCLGSTLWRSSYVNIQVSDSSFLSNYALNGGIVFFSCIVNFTNTVISDNTMEPEKGSVLVLSNTLFSAQVLTATNNNSTYGGTINSSGNSSLIIQDSTFTFVTSQSPQILTNNRNNAAYAGGSIFVTDICYVDMYNTTVRKNLFIFSYLIMIEVSQGTTTANGGGFYLT